MSVPKIIHYCWMSGDPYPEDIAKCIESWREKLPDYTIKLWDCTNFDCEKWIYTKQALQMKKYAFVSDVVRLYALYNEGGIYLDSDIQVFKTFDELLNNSAFTGFESEGRVAAWILASEKGSPIIKQMLDYYDDKTFVDEAGNMDLTPNTIVLTSILKRKGLKPNGKKQELEDITIYPESFFCPKNPWTNEINITDDTYCMHLFKGAWCSENDKKKHAIIYRLLSKGMPLGIARIIAKITIVISQDGVKGVWTEFYKRIRRKKDLNTY